MTHALSRRAKAKLQDTKSGARDAEASPDRSASLTPTKYDTVVLKLIHEDEREPPLIACQEPESDASYILAVSIIPCTDLTIGNWRRISSPGDVHDLVAYVCETKRCLKLVYSLRGLRLQDGDSLPHNVTDTEYKMVAAQTGVASFVLSQPPVFYLKTCRLL